MVRPFSMRTFPFERKTLEGSTIMRVRALRIAAIAFAGALVLVGCKKANDRGSTSGSSSTSNYGTSSSGVPSDQRGTGGSSSAGTSGSSGTSDDVNGTPRSTPEQTQEQQRQHDVTQQNPPKAP